MLCYNSVKNLHQFVQSDSLVEENRAEQRISQVEWNISCCQIQNKFEKHVLHQY